MLRPFRAVSWPVISGAAARTVNGEITRRVVVDWRLASGSGYSILSNSNITRALLNHSANLYLMLTINYSRQFFLYSSKMSLFISFVVDPAITTELATLVVITITSTPLFNINFVIKKFVLLFIHSFIKFIFFTRFPFFFSPDSMVFFADFSFPAGFTWTSANASQSAILPILPPKFSKIMQALHELPPIRIPTLRKGNTVTTSGHNANMKAVLGQHVGQLRKRKFSSFHKNNGPWEECVMVKNQLQTNCANCHYNNEKRGCCINFLHYLFPLFPSIASVCYLFVLPFMRTLK